MLKIFADQAVIAIENVRLFTELGARNRDLTEALEQQTATSEILRVISQSQTDVQPVFDTIAAAALKLCDANSANVFTFDGELIHLAALVNVDPEYVEDVAPVFPAAARSRYRRYPGDPDADASSQFRTCDEDAEYADPGELDDGRLPQRAGHPAAARGKRDRRHRRRAG